MFHNNPLDINTEEWVKLLENKKVTFDKDMEVLSLVYQNQNHEMHGSEIANKLNESSHGTINLQIWRFSDRVLKKTKIKPSWMREQKKKLVACPIFRL
jgi:5-methylcytosine-specific restriction protein A